MTCSSCKNLDEKKKVDGAVSGARYYCKKHKTYVDGSMDACDKYEKCYRDNDTCDKIYEEGRDFDNDKNSASFYLLIGLILLVLLVIAFLFNSDLYGI